MLVRCLFWSLCHLRRLYLVSHYLSPECTWRQLVNTKRICGVSGQWGGSSMSHPASWLVNVSFFFTPSNRPASDVNSGSESTTVDSVEFWHGCRHSTASFPLMFNFRDSCLISTLQQVKDSNVDCDFELHIHNQVYNQPLPSSTNPESPCLRQSQVMYWLI